MDVQRYFLVNVVCFLEFVISPPHFSIPKGRQKTVFEVIFLNREDRKLGIPKNKKRLPTRITH